MGLEDFMDIDEDEGTDKQTKSETEKEASLEKFDNYREKGGDLKKVGPYGYESQESFEDTIVGKLDEHGNLFKYYLPIFPHIEMRKKYDRGSRYRIESTQQTVTCASVMTTRLRKVNRDIVMLDTGEVDKDKVLDILSERFSYDVQISTSITLYFFAKINHIVKMAIGDSKVDNWSLKDKEHILKAIYKQSYTQRFRESSSVAHELKHIDHIEPW